MQNSAKTEHFYRFLRRIALRNDKSGCFVGRLRISLWALLLCSGIGALPQSTAPPLNANASFSIRATHLLGLPNTKNDCKGTLSTQDNTLRFQQSGKLVTEVDIASVRSMFLGEQNMQVGGVPMKIGKAVAPYGGGRVVSLFAHAKYDTLTLQYVDSNGGVPWCDLPIEKGQGELVKNELVARVSSSSGEDQLTKKSTPEVTHEDK